MNALSGETWTAKQLAERFNVTSATINNHARVLFGKVPSGHHRHFDEAQVTMILESIKNAKPDNPRFTKRKKVLSSLETELTPELVTLESVANMTGAAYSTVASYAQKAGWTKDGKQTLLDENQVTIILEAMKRAKKNQHDLPSSVEAIHTSKSRALRIELLHKQIEAELNDEIAELKQTVIKKDQVIVRQAEQIEDQSIELSQSKRYKSTIQVMRETGEKEYPWRPLKSYCNANDLPIKKSYTQSFGEINAYPIEAWEAVFGIKF
ncbi:hypothetical protein FACS1894164_19310 [Spirochaetia bacterium]|nr:hypothetical protein FACS1894164_19310 [Spirochaetia bacterium]